MAKLFLSNNFRKFLTTTFTFIVISVNVTVNSYHHPHFPSASVSVDKEMEKISKNEIEDQGGAPESYTHNIDKRQVEEGAAGDENAPPTAGGGGGGDQNCQNQNQCRKPGEPLKDKFDAIGDSITSGFDAINEKINHIFKAINAKLEAWNKWVVQWHDSVHVNGTEH